MPYINEEGNNVPENSIVYYSKNKKDAESNNWKIEDVVESLIGHQKRDYFPEHAYFCLPLTIANQYGFAIKAATDMEIFWPGGETRAIVKLKNSQWTDAEGGIQSYYTNFEHGIISVENSFMFRTPPGVNLMVIPTPNYYIDGIMPMTGVVEADNLRRSFTINLKVTTPNKKINIKKGDWISTLIPIPRYYVDSYKLVDFDEVFDEKTYLLEKASIDRAKYERQVGDREKNVEDGLYSNNPLLLGMGRKYFKGIYPNGKEFPDHQKRIEPPK